MTDRRLFVTFTMDCERVQVHGSYGLEGPVTWEMSERAITGFAEVLLARGFAGTFFIVPETARKHTSLFLDLEEKGFELGMHYHPQLYRVSGYSDFLGGYCYEEQLRLLGEARDDWAQAFGRLPESFRPGNFSANDCTFRALYELGLRQGSVSAPEREITFYRAVWRGAPMYPHHVHPNFRLLEGDLDFYEVPVTVDPDPARRVWEGTSAFELRIELAQASDHFLTIDRRIGEMIAGNVPVKALVSITHNMFDYADGGDERRKTLEAVTGYVREVAEGAGLEAVPATICKLHLMADGAEGDIRAGEEDPLGSTGAPRVSRL